MLRESINEVVESFERLVETMEDNGTDSSIVELIEDAKTAFLEMHEEEEGELEDD